MLSMIKWCDIDFLHTVYRKLQKREEKTGNGFPDSLVYQAKVKVHGANSAVQCFRDGLRIAQGRARILTPDDDERGFGKWVHSRLGFSIRWDFVGNDRCTVFGEWCGPGVMAGAISQIPRRTFVIFALRVGSKVVVDPEQLQRIVSVESDEVKILPWHHGLFVVNWRNRESLEVVARLLGELVSQVEDCDPWVKQEYGIEGVGEGVVLYPLGISVWRDFSRLVFKAKGDKHRKLGVKDKSNRKKAIPLDPQVAKSINEFVDMFVTESRLEQGLEEACGGVFDSKLKGKFIAWISKDVLKESEVEREVSNLKWIQVARDINRRAAQWYQGKIGES